MEKSPEEYLSEMDFSPEETRPGRDLNSDERAFVEKYLGLDVLENLPRISPKLEPKPEIPPAVPRLQVAEKTPEPTPQIVVAPPPVYEKKEILAPQKPVQHIVVSDAEPEVKQKEVAAPAKEITIAPESEAAAEHIREDVRVTTETTPPATVSPGVTQPTVSPEVTTAAEVETLLAPAPEKTLPTLRELLKDEKEIQAVSFYVADQLFLLPVAAIQEVLRHLELVKVPKAPDFVAGVVNLRGRVTPLVYLSALLTNRSERNYSDKNFIIVCGSDTLQIGLIIDRINSMHVIPRENIIWNAEAKLGDAAEYLAALATLDDKVRGIVAPEVITQKILAN